MQLSGGENYVDLPSENATLIQEMHTKDMRNKHQLEEETWKYLSASALPFIIIPSAFNQSFPQSASLLANCKINTEYFYLPISNAESHFLVRKISMTATKGNILWWPSHSKICLWKNIKLNLILLIFRKNKKDVNEMTAAFLLGY